MPAATPLNLTHPPEPSETSRLFAAIFGRLIRHSAPCHVSCPETPPWGSFGIFTEASSLSVLEGRDLAPGNFVVHVPDPRGYCLAGCPSSPTVPFVALIARLLSTPPGFLLHEMLVVWFGGWLRGLVTLRSSSSLQGFLLGVLVRCRLLVSSLSRFLALDLQVVLHLLPCSFFTFPILSCLLSRGFGAGAPAQFACPDG